MSKHSENEKQKEEQKHRESTRKEKLAEYFFSLSNTILGTLVIGVALLLIETDKDISVWVTTTALFFGLIFSYALAKVGNNILK